MSAMYNLHNYFNQINHKLSCEGINKENYSKEKAINILSHCVAGSGLIRILNKYEEDVLILLK